MNLSPLNNLHKEFTIALNQHSYMGCVKNQPKKLEHTSKKTIRLAEVFKLAQNEIETSLQNKPASIDQEITHLKLLQGDGKNFYARYQKSTNTWKRWFLKGLAKCTPGLLKKILPRCFSNKMKQAEQTTSQEFKKYDILIENTIKNLSQQKNISPNNKPKPPSPNPAKPNPVNPNLAKPNTNKPGKKDSDAQPDNSKKDEKPGMSVQEQEMALQELLLAQLANGKNNKNPKPEIELPQIAGLSKEEIAAFCSDSADPIAANNAEDNKTKKKTAINTLANIQQAFENLQNFSKHPLTLEKFKKDLITICQGIKTLAKVDSTGQEALKKFGLDDKHLVTFNQPDLLQELIQDTDNAKILELLKDTDWHPNFEEAMNQKGILKFGYTKLLQSIVLMDEDKKKVNESVLQNYRGEIKIKIPSIESLIEFESLVQYLEKNPTCLPNRLNISLTPNQNLTPEFVKCLLKLQEFAVEINIVGLKALDFPEMNLSQDEELSFVKLLHRFDFPELERVFLSEHPKADWTAQDFSKVIKLYPNIDLLLECFNNCADYEDIIIPAKLTAAEEFSPLDCSIDQINYLLSQFTHLRKLTFGTLAESESEAITEAQLIKWINQPNLKHQLKTLDIDGCTSLTTDILPFLAAMPHLTCVLPDLPQGKMALNKLPKSSNPFQIKMLYTQSKATQAIAAKLYTGPHLWSPVFQIPLVRDGVTDVFNPNQRQLGPKSIAYWLFGKDYKAIDPKANNIIAIIADSNEMLNDDNIVEFMQKFPKAKTLSLSNCPNVTEKGIISLLKACPNIKFLELTGNLHIKEDLLLNDGNFDVLQKMTKIILTGTGIHSSIIESFTGANGSLIGKIIFENVNLTIPDEVLVNVETFEKFLNGQELNHLKRIDLENCQDLTDEMLSKLLDRMNEPTLLKSQDGTFKSNPQRLNIAVLNLKGCPQITNKAFHQNLTEPASKDDEATTSVEKKKKIETKILETLDRVIIGDTKLTPILSDLYPKITFQKDDKPITISMDLDLQLEGCVNYHKLQEHSLINGCSDEEQTVLKKLAADYVHNRVAVELFGHKIDGLVDSFTENESDENSDDESIDDDASIDKENSYVEFVCDQAIDPQAKEFCDITLCFKTNDAADPTIFHTHRDILYHQSNYFVLGFRPGGFLNKNSDIVFINQHANPKAVHILIDFLHGKIFSKDLDWQTAANVAELVGLQNCNLAPALYNNLLNHIHSLFDLKNADGMLLAAMKLKDQNGIKLYENALLSELKLKADDQKTFQAIANIAQSHALKNLSAEVKKIQDIKTQELIDKLKNQK